VRSQMRSNFTACEGSVCEGFLPRYFNENNNHMSDSDDSDDDGTKFPVTLRSPEGTHNALMIDGRGRCICEGTIMTLGEAAALVAPRGLNVGRGWRFWKALDGRPAWHFHRDKSQGGDESPVSDDDNNGVDDNDDDNDDDINGSLETLKAADWVWCIRDRVRGALADARSIRTGIGDRGSTSTTSAGLTAVDEARMRAVFSEKVYADHAVERLSDLADRFNSQVGLRMRAQVTHQRTVNEARDNTIEHEVWLIIREAPPVPGPTAVARAEAVRVRALLVNQICPSAFLEEMVQRWDFFNRFTGARQRTPFRVTSWRWTVPCGKYQWKKPPPPPPRRIARQQTSSTDYRAVPFGEALTADLRTYRAVCEMLSCGVPEMDQRDGVLHCSVSFIREP
jgi:hypothetical protein